MKQYIFLLFSLFLAACAEKDISGVDGPTGPNSGLRLSVRLSSGVATRALGTPSPRARKRNASIASPSSSTPPKTASRSTRPSPTT